MRKRAGDWLDIVEAVYDLDRPEEQWLTEIADATRAKVDRGFGLYAFSYDSTDPADVQYKAFVTRGLDHEVAMQAQRVLSAEEVETSVGVCGTTSAFFKDKFPHRAMREFGHPLGIRDAIGIGAHDPSGFGVAIIVPLPEIVRLSPSQTVTLERVAAHIIAAVRLRQRLASASRAGTDPSSNSEAVLAPDGAIAHAVGPARERGAQEALRQAAARLELARGRLRQTEPERALAHWRGLVSARWSLIDRFEAGGRRYVLAVENEPKPRGHASLSARERQVVAFASLGHTNKLIAYELGIAHSTVKVLLARAAAKMGVSSRAELLRSVASSQGT